jgi:hypothetical protein
MVAAKLHNFSRLAKPLELTRQEENKKNGGN